MGRHCEAAKRFAEAQGFTDEGALLTDYSRERYEAFLRGEVDLEATGDQHIDGGDGQPRSGQPIPNSGIDSNRMHSSIYQLLENVKNWAEDNQRPV